jgi:hypothetical protein
MLLVVSALYEQNIIFIAPLFKTAQTLSSGFVEF